MDPIETFFPGLANMSLVAAQTQNQAFQANNEANTQIIQSVEKVETLILNLFYKISQLESEVQTLKTQIKTSDQVHNQQIIALMDQVNAVQKQSKDTAQKEVRHLAKTVALEQKSTTLEQNLNAHKNAYDKHYHVIDRMVIRSDPSDGNKVIMNRVIKATEGPSQ